MRRIGVTTVARWMTEKLPKNITAYMEYKGYLDRLKRIRSHNGSIQPIFFILPTRHTNFSDEFLANVSFCRYSLESPVYLTTGKNLVGVTVADIASSMEPASYGCWALRNDEAVRGIALDEQYALQRATESRGVSQTIPWCG